MTVVFDTNVIVGNGTGSVNRIVIFWEFAVLTEFQSGDSALTAILQYH